MALNRRSNPLANLRFLDVGDDDNDIGKEGENDNLPLTNAHVKLTGMVSSNSNKVGQPLPSLKNETKVTNDAEQNLTLSSLDESLDDIDSIQFELDEDAFKEIDDDGSSEEEVTLDITEGGPCDVKNFHEIYQIDIDNEDNQESVDDKQSKIKTERPKSAKTRIRNVEPSLEIKDDLDNYIDGNVDDDDDFSLNSIENDPFASEGVGMFKVSRQDFITVPSFPLNHLETLKEEPDEDIKKEDDEEEDGDEVETDEFEEDDLSNGDEQIEEDVNLADIKQKHLLIDSIGQQANFRKMSDQLKKEISKLKNELFTVITLKSDEIAKQATERLDKVEKILSENDKNSVLLDKNRNQIDVATSGSDSLIQVDAIKLEVNSLKTKVDKIMENDKERDDKENDIAKNLVEIHDEFKITMDQFRDFKKDNDLAIKALRKQLTEVSKSQDNLESLTSKIQGDVHRLSREVSNVRRDDDDEQDNLRIEVKQMIMKERAEHDKLVQSIEEIKQMLKSEITSFNQSLEKRKQESELSQATINDEMSQTKSVLHYLTKELDTIKQSIDEKKNESKESENTTINAALEERFNQIESNLSVMHGQLEAFKISKERERKMRSKFDSINSKRSRKLISSCSSYEDTLSSSSEEVVKSRTKQRLRTQKDYDIGTSNQNRSKINHDHGMNRRRDYIKYSPLHFSPILITSQPMERSHKVKNSSSSLLAMIRRTSRLLQDEASDLDGLGNYRFVSDISNGLMNRNDLDTDESAIRKLKQIRCDIDEKLKRLNTMVNANSNGNNSSTTK